MENMELDSDKEYDNLTKRVWEKAQRSGGATIQISDDDEEVHGEISQAQDFFQRTLLSRRNCCYQHCLT